MTLDFKEGEHIDYPQINIFASERSFWSYIGYTPKDFSNLHQDDLKKCITQMYNAKVKRSDGKRLFENLFPVEKIEEILINNHIPESIVNNLLHDEEFKHE